MSSTNVLTESIFRIQDDIAILIEGTGATTETVDPG
jgi:hypothetical protein